MKTIIVKTQAELDALPASFSEYTQIQIHPGERVVVRSARGNSNVVAWGNSNVVAWGNSNVEAWGNSNVEAWGNSNVEAWGNSNVVAWGNSNVVAWGNSNVEARGNSNVVAWGNSNVEAWGNSNVVAWGNSNVVAWGNSNVVARGNVGVHNCSPDTSLELFGFAVVWFVIKTRKCIRRSKTCTVITPKQSKGTAAWLEGQAVKSTGGKVILFKRVSKEFKTQEGTANETTWTIGSTLEHPNWKPKSQECGDGKFHACSRPYFCDEFRSIPGDRYVAIKIAVKDLFAWPNPDYPHKITFRKGTVLHECNKFGKEIKP